METIPLLSEEEKLCRYCFEPVDDLYKYCDCSGSQAYLHHKCLVKWYETNNFMVNKCEICNTNFKVKIIRSNKKEECKNIFKYLLSFLFLVIINITTLFIIPTYIDKDITNYNVYNLAKILIFIGSFTIISMILQLYKNKIKYTLIQSSD